MKKTNKRHIHRQNSQRFAIRKDLFTRFGERCRKLWHRFLGLKLRYRVLIVLGVLILTDFMAIIQPYLVEKSYALGSAESLLTDKAQAMANKISYDQKAGTYTFKGGASSTTEALQNGNTAITSVVNKDSSKGMSVTDTINSIGFSMTPKFRTDDGRQDGNRIVYPLTNGNTGWLVYTMEGTGVKEDILLTKSDGDSATFTYSLDLGDSLVARLESDGSIGIYGNTLLSGNITTGTDADAALLEKARKNAQKDTYLFGIPTPTILESGKKISKVEARFELDGSTLKLHVNNLTAGHYPLTIDPSIYVVTAQQFMAGNNETNVNFDVANKLIKKGRTTGARFDSWTTTSNLPTSEWSGASVGAGGYLYTIGGTTFTGQVYSSQGTDTYTVPAGVTSLTVKMWGAGGGGGGGAATNIGGAGAGGGYVTETITVTPGEVLTIYVGGGGNGGAYNSGGSDAGGGGAGGGYSSLYRSATALAIAAGGGGGGGARNATIGAAGGAGGGTSGIIGATVSGGAGGGPGTPSAGGAAGAGTNTGVAGTSLTGGAGADGRSSNSTDGSGATAGLASGGRGGLANASGNTYAAGGGGGAGLFGGGGGGGSANTNGRSGGGGGGGSSYTIPGATGVTNSAGSGTSPGNAADSYRAGAGDGGAGGATLSTGTPGDNGIVVITYGTGMAPSQAVNWAQLDTGSGTINSANPGTGPCSGWCTTSAYNLPSARSNFSLVAYNGFLYAMGGTDASGNRQSTVYVAKLGANGEPQLWHPNNADKSTWVYWYSDTGLSSTRSSFGAVAYNNRMYVVGGLTGVGAGTPVSSTQIADINPNGTLGSWSTSTALSSTTYGNNVHVYNDRLYVIGGSSSIGGAPSTAISYNKINSNGSLNSWQTTTPMSNGRMQTGGNFSVIWGAYIYVSGGCGTVNGSGYCTNIRNDTQVASINTDGSIDVWNTVGGVTDQRMGHSLFAWRDRIYEVGGCSSQNTTSGDCTSMLDTINYGTINPDGEASTVADSVPSGTAPCSGANPETCNLPGVSYIGNVLTGSAIMNGYLYIWGGCSNTDAGCTSVSRGVVYTAIGSDGSLTKPASCGSWTVVDSYCYNTTSLPAGLAAPGSAIANGYIYSVGGFRVGGMAGNIYRTAPDSTNGSISSWTATDLTTIGASDVSYTYSFARSNPSQASSIPNNLYIVGGCIGATGVGCPSIGGYTERVYKCNLDTAGAPSACVWNTQLQIGTVPGADTAGLGAMAGTIYANYIYLMGGLAQGATDLKTTRYAKIDDNNNIVAVSGGTWVESPNLTFYGRRRGSGFGYNGYLYVIGGYDGSGGGVLADIEFAKINVSDGSIGAWTVSTVSINQRWGLTMTVSNSFAYVIGGCVNGNAPTCAAAGQTNSIQTFQVYNNDSGAPAAYSTSANTYGTNPNRIGVSSTVLNGYIYAAGGCTGLTDCMNPVSTVSYAPLDVYGNVGSWSNTTGSLPDVRAWGKLLTAGGSLYYVGGQDANGTSQASVYYATPSSGNVSSWSTASNGLPASRTEFGAAVWNNRLYVVGGNTGSSNTIIYNSAGTNSFVVPTGVTSMTVEAWGAGGGGGNGSSSTGTGGAGGGGGYAQSTLTVTPGESLTVNVGTGGAKAVAASNGGNGGGFSAVLRSSTYLIQAGGGGGGGGSMGTNTNNGGAGGAGGGTSGVIGAVGAGTATRGGPGGPGTTAAGGAGGVIGSSGAAGYSGLGNLGGDAGGSGATCATVVTTRGGNGGIGAGGKGGTAATCVGGGGAGGGRYGGGGGGSATNGASRGSGGGGGGSSLTTGTANTETVGSGTTPGNSADALRVGTAGAGGTGSTSTASTAGAAGEVVITYNTNVDSATVYVSPQLNSGGNITSAWSTSSTNFNVARSGATVVAYANNLYLLGGHDGTYYLNDTQYAQINGTTGNVGAWTNSESLPAPMANGDGFAVNGYIYLIGGRSADTSCTPSTLVAPISANTTIATGNNPTGVGVWYETHQRYGGARYGNAATYHDGKAYVLGGGCGAQTSYASPVVQQTTLLTQPQVAKYSIMFDTDSDVFPNSWLLNGLDNSIGARWQLKYQSMTNPTATGPNGTGKNCSAAVMTSWGQTTNFGDVTLMQPGIYTPRDGSNADTNCARYYYFSISIDSSQAFGYPDDVSRGPTITDLTLNFTADPAKRLMHGRTFVGGLQMPDDTPYYTN
ncbi:MAG: hypothetical protein WBO35_03915 [Candidatus Saccharimonadales bacterium]